jgi:hemoglobin/transferrin/lactoferrin receptor protein
MAGISVFATQIVFPIKMKYTITLFLVFNFFTAVFSQTEQHDSLQQVVISANKIAEQKRDIPNQVEIITANKIQQISPQNTADLLQNSGEVFVQKSQQGGGSPVLRGFEANRVLLVVDGVRMNNAIFRSGHLQNIVTLDPNAIDRIEVLHGAGSVIYGTDAIGGVISIYTKRPELSQTGNVTTKIGGFVRYSSANQGKATNANVNIGGKNWANYFSISGNDFGDLTSGKNDLKKYPNFGDLHLYVERIDGRDSVLRNSNPNIQKNSGYRQIDILEKFLFAPKGALRHTFNLQYSNSNNVPRFDRLSELLNEKPRFAEWYYGPQQRLFASYQVDYAAEKKFADLIRFTPAFQKVQESRHDRRLNAEFRNDRTEDLGLLTFNLDFFKNKGEQELRYGAEWAHNQLESTGSKTSAITQTTAPIASRYPNGTYATTGIYVAHRWEILGKKLILSDGLRFSTVAMKVKFDEQFYSVESLRDVQQSSKSLNFNLGLVTNLKNGFRAAALFSSGFRNPNIDDASKIFQNTNNTLNIPNPNLKPEQVLHREISLGQQFGDVGEINASLFLSTLTDAIATRPTTFDGKNYIVYAGDTLAPVHSTNVAKAEVKGFSLRGRVRLGAFFTLSGSAMKTIGKDLTDAAVPLDHIPPFVGNVRLAYTQGKWSLETDLLFNGKKKLADYSASGEDNLQYATPEGMPAWQVWNVRGAYKITEKVKVQAAVENILDLNYRVFASGINGSGRSLVVGVYYR